MKNQALHNQLYTFSVSLEDKDCRIDQFITKNLPDFSRSFIQKIIDEKYLKVNQKSISKPSYRIQLNDVIEITIPKIDPGQLIPEELLPANITTLAKEKDFIILCKPAGITIHKPQPTSKEITLADWLLHTYPEVKNIGSEERPGIIHRLDKDTSGILIVARTENGHKTFTDLFKSRNINKTYLAVVAGHPPQSGTIDYNITRHPTKRNKMTISSTQGRQSLTHYKVITYFENTALIEVKPVTGRTHQIRVHMAAINHPVLGDTLYGQKSKLIKRQALHAQNILFTFNNQNYEFSCEPPTDFLRVLKLSKALKF